MSRATRSAIYNSENVLSSQGEKMDVTRGRGSRAFGRDITNATNVTSGASAKNASKVEKKSIFSSILPSQETFEESKSDVREYMQRPADDIDSRDASNPLLVTEYADRMYDHFRIIESKFRVNGNYMKSVQSHINVDMRETLIDWLVEVHAKFKQVPETLFLTVNIIDRFLELKSTRRSKLQLVGVAALLLASKYEEIYPPEIRDLVYLTDHAYTKKEILEMENQIITALQYEMTVPTIHTFLCRYLKAAHADRTIVQLACYIAERCLQEYSMCSFLPSTTAATCILIARKTIQRQSSWSPTLLKYTKLDEVDMEDCADAMKVFLDNTGSKEQEAVKRKYSSSRYGSVAKLEMKF